MSEGISFDKLVEDFAVLVRRSEFTRLPRPSVLPGEHEHARYWESQANSALRSHVAALQQELDATQKENAALKQKLEGWRINFDAKEQLQAELDKARARARELVEVIPAALKAWTACADPQCNCISSAAYWTLEKLSREGGQ